MTDAFLNHVDYSTYYGKNFGHCITPQIFEENTTTDGTETNLVGQAGDNTFNLSVDA